LAEFLIQLFFEHLRSRIPTAIFPFQNGDLRFDPVAEQMLRRRQRPSAASRFEFLHRNLSQRNEQIAKLRQPRILSVDQRPRTEQQQSH
jgi:hypothetical protein